MGVKSKLIKKITYGVEDSFHEAKENQEIRNLGEKIALYYGDARHERGMHLLIDSLKYLDKEITMLLCIRNVHEGFNKKKLEELCERQNNLKIIFVGDYPCSIQDIVKSVDLVVLPFIKNTLEPPLTLMEVSTVGTPLVTTNIGGNREVVDNGSILIDDINPKKLAEKINSAIEVPIQTEKIKYPWSSTIRDIEKIYNSLS